jgi:hypothetical protein
MEHIGRAAETEPEMLGHFEPSAGDDRRVEAVPKEIVEPIGFAAGPARESGDPMLGRYAGDVVACFNERVEHMAVTFEQGCIAVVDLVQMLQRKATESLSLMSLIDSEQVVQAPHSFGELGFRQVFLTTLSAKFVLGAVTFLLAFAVLYANIRLAQSALKRRDFVVMGPEGARTISVDLGRLKPLLYVGGGILLVAFGMALWSFNRRRRGVVAAAAA